MAATGRASCCCTGDVSPDAHVADAAFAVERLRLDPVALVGQSLGGRTALLIAAERPELVRGLVVADASPHGGDDADVVEVDLAALEQSLRRWPVPFASRDAAVASSAVRRSAPRRGRTASSTVTAAGGRASTST